MFSCFFFCYGCAESYESRFDVTFWFLSICKMQFNCSCVVSCLSVCEFIVSGYSQFNCRARPFQCHFDVQLHRHFNFVPAVQSTSMTNISSFSSRKRLGKKPSLKNFFIAVYRFRNAVNVAQRIFVSFILPCMHTFAITLQVFQATNCVFRVNFLGLSNF